MKVEQRRRKELLEKRCKTLQLPRALEELGKWNLRHFIIHNHLFYKFAFNFIPKVACTTWKKIFDQLESSRRYLGLSNANMNDVKSHWNSLKQYRKAVFVREPLTRLLSAYLSKFCNHNKTQRIWEHAIGRYIVWHYRNCTPPTAPPNSTAAAPFMDITFTEFIRFIIEIGNGMPLNGGTDHFLPQHWVALPCENQYDFIGHFENLSTEAPYLLKFLGVADQVIFPPIRSSRAAWNLVDEYRKVPLELVYKLGEYYYEDYQLFGYSFNDTLKKITG